VNEYPKDPMKREIMEKCLFHASKIVAFTEIMAQEATKVHFIL
jgi:hypothetical protein